MIIIDYIGITHLRKSPEPESIFFFYNGPRDIEIDLLIESRGITQISRLS